MKANHKKNLKVSLWHPFSASAVGLSEDIIISSHSRPHVKTLKRLTADNGWRCSVEYITQKWYPYSHCEEGLTWKFWPISFRWSENSRKWRKQWSLTGLANMLINPVDILILNMSGHGSKFTFKLAQIARLRQKRYIAMLGGRHITLTPALIRYYRESSLIISHTQELKSAIKEMPELTGIPPVTVLPLGVDCTLFSPANNRGERNGVGPVLLYVGRIVPWKQVHLAIETLARVKSDFPQSQLHIIGPSSSDDYVQQLHTMAHEFGLEDAIYFHGVVPYHTLPHWYQTADLLLMPSRGSGESFGMVAVESLACGTPVVAIRGHGGPNEIITDGTDGLLLEEPEYAEEVWRLLQRPDHLRKMRTFARQKAVSNFSHEVTASIFLNCVNQALGTYPGEQS